MKQDLKSKETQNIILNASFDLFYKNGYSATSIPDVMKKTSLSKGAFYHHFKNKHEIGVRVIDEIIKKRIFDGFINPLRNTDKNIPELLLYVFNDRIRNFSEKENSLGCPAINLIGEIGYTEQEFRIILRSLIEDWRKAIINAVNIGKSRNEIKNNINPSSVATTLICAYEGVRSLRKIYDDDKVYDEYIESIAIFIKNLSV
ncbi:MAG: TetR/AcrR family transcriptional regulator [Flavobacteriaceae bacterium]|nr:TetR/AcrR family transcriptional regulator [Flavobacteriaceae bacterium]